MGLPDLSNTSSRPVIPVLPLFTKAICVAHPPPSANWGKMIAVLPPAMPGAGVKDNVPAASTLGGMPAAGVVFATEEALNAAHAKRNPKTEIGKELCTRTLPVKPVPTEKSSLTNFAVCSSG